LPDAVIACVGGGSNALGIFTDFVGDAAVRLIGVEPAGKGLDSSEHGATLLRGRPGVLHGAETYILQDEDGQIINSWSVSAGLDYPGVGPEHAFLKDSGRAEYVGATDEEALAAFALLARSEGIVCAFESAHALAHALKLAEAAREETVLLVNISGRGDKDMEQARRLLKLVTDRYDAMFARLDAAGEGAFGAFVILGDPDLETSAAILDRWSRAGRTCSRSASPSPIRSPTGR
jgi:tryptophan synthase beta chain